MATDTLVAGAEYAGGKAVEGVVNITGAVIAEIPSILLKLAKGEIVGATLDLGFVVGGEVVKLGLTVAADGTWVIATAAGRTIWSGSQAGAEKFVMFLAKMNEAGYQTEFSGGVVKVLKDGQVAFEGTPDEVQEFVASAGQVVETVTETVEELSEEGVEAIEEVAGQYDALITGGITAIDNLLPLPFDAASLILEKAGVDVERLKQENPDAAKTGATVGLLAGLVGGPLALGKMAANLVKAGIRKGTREVAGRKGVRKIGKLTDELKALLKEVEDDLRKVAIKSPSAKATLTTLRKNMKKELEDADALLRNWQSKLNIERESPEAVRKWLVKEIRSLPESHILKQIPDPYESIWDKLPTINPQRQGSWLRQQLRSLEQNFDLFKRNLPSELAGVLGNYGGDFAANYAFAYNHALKDGKSDEEARAAAFGFAFQKSPSDVLADLVERIGPGAVGDLMGTAIRTGVAWDKIEDGKLDFGDDSDAVTADNLDADTSYANSGGLIARAKVKGAMLNQMGLVAPRR